MASCGLSATGGGKQLQTVIINDDIVTLLTHVDPSTDRCSGKPIVWMKVELYFG
jgi:hypothetical protein